MNSTSKVALITGSSKNIGRAIALELAAAEWRVVINSRAPSRESEDTLRAIEAQGGDAYYIAADVTDEAQVKFLFAKTIEKYGAIDLLVNNVGAGQRHSFKDARKQEFLDAWNVNVMSAVLCSIQAVRAMEKSGSGKIINIASVRGLGHAGHPEMMAYSIAKSALLSLTQTLAKDLAPHILVNAIAPGYVDCSGASPAASTLANKTLLERLVVPADVARAVMYFAGSEVSTGQVMVVDGGFSLT